MRKLIFLIILVLIFMTQSLIVKGKALPDMQFQLYSNVFKDGSDIPVLYSSTSRGKNFSPPLFWKNPPPGTNSFALIVLDLDIPFRLFTFNHWVIYNIPSEKRGLPVGIPHQTAFPDGTIQGKNGYGQNGYLGPNPVWGRHRYQFTIYALDTIIPPNPNMNDKKLLKAIERHILDQAQLIGSYSKK